MRTRSIITTSLGGGKSVQLLLQLLNADHLDTLQSIGHTNVLQEVVSFTFPQGIPPPLDGVIIDLILVLLPLPQLLLQPL